MKRFKVLLFNLGNEKFSLKEVKGYQIDSIAVTFIGRRFFNIADRFDAFYEFTDFLNKYDFKICKVQIYIRCDLGFQALLIAIS